MNVSLQSSKSNDWNSDSSAGHLTVPLKSLVVGKEMTIDVPATNVSGLNWIRSTSEKKIGELEVPRGCPHSPHSE